MTVKFEEDISDGWKRLIVAIAILTLMAIVSLQAIVVGIEYNFLPTVTTGAFLFTLTLYWSWKVFRWWKAGEVVFKERDG
jgi:uncharacterized membrane protein YkgB